jgi:cytolysin-activating lysine-acyltransferase
VPEIDLAEMNEADGPQAKTMGGIIGEVVWLMSQSPTHKHLSLGDLEWLLMPSIILEQYKTFHEDEKPVGAALWGYLSDEAAHRLKVAGRLAPQYWGNNAIQDPEKGLVAKEGGTLWLVELVTPFHNETNKHREQMIADLMQTVFKDKKFKTMHINPKTGVRERKLHWVNSMLS